MEPFLCIAAADLCWPRNFVNLLSLLLWNRLSYLEITEKMSSINIIIRCIQYAKTKFAKVASLQNVKKLASLLESRL